MLWAIEKVAFYLVLIAIFWNDENIWHPTVESRHTINSEQTTNVQSMVIKASPNYNWDIRSVMTCEGLTLSYRINTLFYI